MNTKIDVTVKAGLFGDALLGEPAICAYSRNLNRKINLYMKWKECSTIYTGNPFINLYTSDPGNDKDGITLDESEAFSWCVNNPMNYFSSGFFHQLGMDHTGHRKNPIVYDLDHNQYIDNIVICPFSRSCASQTSNGGLPANKMAPSLDWWQEIIKQSPLPVITLGSSSDPEIPNTISIRGVPLRVAIETALCARVLITIDTFFVHVSGMRQYGTIFLNSALPPWFCRPVNVDNSIIHASSPYHWSKKSVVDLMALYCRLSQRDSNEAPGRFYRQLTSENKGI